LGDDKDCKITEYASKYPAYDIQGVPKSFKPVPQLIRDGGRIEDETTFKADYIPHPLQEKYTHKQGLYEKPAGTIDGTTTYLKDYPGKYAEKTASMKPVRNYDGNEIPFEGNPTYKDDYKQWDTSRTKMIKKDNLYMPPTVAMDNSTTNKTDYIARDITKTRSFKPDNMAMMSSEPFDDLTNHKINYVSHPMPDRFHKAKDEYRPSREPLDSLTTAQRDYQGYNVARVESFKPKNAGIKSDAPLDDATEFKDSYKQWDMPKREMHARDPYIKPAGRMDDTTSHRNDYVMHPMNPTRSMKPVNNTSQNDAQFDDSTTFKTDYKPWAANHSIRQDPSRKDYQLPTVPFEGNPTYRAHYVEHGLNPTKSYKPDNFIDANRAPFEGDTSYKTEYTRKQGQLCPVVELPRHGYKFVETNAQGHQFYAK
jgi:hypothetical protein